MEAKEVVLPAFAVVGLRIEANLDDYVYEQWMREHGHELKGYDFEVWDERYKPESSDNEIDMYVALR